MSLPFSNDDSRLKKELERVSKEREQLGLNGLVGGLECVVINTEPDRQLAATEGLLRTTGLTFEYAFEDADKKTCVLKKEGSADFLVTSRKSNENPFRSANAGPKSAHLPNTRMETLVFKCPEIEKFVAIQKSRGLEFMTDEIVETDVYKFIQTKPSPYTGNSIGYIAWTAGREGAYCHDMAGYMDLHPIKPDSDHLKNIFELDHMATRVRAEERDAAIIEFMELTNYNFEFSVYVESLNSITNVSRLSLDDYAMVFTSGIEPFKTPEDSGPTELFIYNYNTRVHHMAFRTEQIEATYAGLEAHGQDFLVELVGSPEEGLKQTFTKPSPDTLLVNEYIQRYEGFTGVFTKSNVTLLTEATTKQ